MELYNQIREYIVGTKFSNGEKFTNTKKYSETSRTDILKTISAGKNIIHLGCLDHVEMIEEKRKKGIWLHQILMDSAKHCIGIDINEAGILKLKDQLKIQDIFYADILREPLKEITAKKWDYIILGEILEHTDNPVLFLNRIKDLYKGNIDKMIITAPNVLNYETFSYLENNTEFINTDHRYWFTSYTLSKVIHQSGLTVTNLRYCNRIPLSNYQLAIRKIKKLILKKDSVYPFPYFSTLMIECTL